MEPARQCLRHSDGLSDAGARRLDRRLADLRPDRRLPLRRRRVLDQVAAGSDGRAVVERARREPGAEPAVGVRGRVSGHAERVGRMGRRRRDRAVGDLPRLRRRSPARGAVAVDGGVAVVRRRRGRRRAPSRAGRPPARAATPRALPVGLGLSLGRVARARRRSQGTGGVRGVPPQRQGRRRHRLLRLLGAADGADRGGDQPGRRGGALPRVGGARARRLGRPSSSARTAGSARTLRPTMSVRSRSTSFPPSCAPMSPPGWSS